MAQVSTPPLRIMHRWRVVDSPPVKVWIVERADSKMLRNLCSLSVVWLFDSVMIG